MALRHRRITSYSKLRKHHSLKPIKYVGFGDDIPHTVRSLRCVGGSRPASRASRAKGQTVRYEDALPSAIEVRGRTFESIATETHSCTGCAAFLNEELCGEFEECVRQGMKPMIWVERKPA